MSEWMADASGESSASAAEDQDPRANQSGRGQHRADTGSLGEEATRFFAAAQDLLARGVGNAQTAHIANGAPECTWCPLCQMIALLRGDRPEISERVAEASAAAASLLHVMADIVGNALTPQQTQAPHGPSGTNDASSGARVQRIPLDVQRPSGPAPTE